MAAGLHDQRHRHAQRGLEGADGSDYGAFQETLEEGESGAVIVPETSFYATMGGQESDTGLIEGPEGLFRVREALHLTGGTAFTCYYLQDWSAINRVKNFSINSPVPVE